MKTLKYEYEMVIQQNNGYGWDDVDFHEAHSNGLAIDRKALRTNLKAYRENTNYPTRVIFRKTKVENCLK